MELILCCSCFNMEKKAKETFVVLFPEKDFPMLIKGKDKIFKFSQEIKNEHIKAISKLSGRFAYYVEIDDGKITKEYDLVRGKRVA